MFVHTGPVLFNARTPEWVTPPAREVEDLHWLSHRAYEETQRVWTGGVTAALSWVRGIRRGPITTRDERPVTDRLARAEMWAADACLDPNLPLGKIYRDLDVAPWPPIELDRDYAGGVRAVLLWLVEDPAVGILPPLPVPVRLADGTTPTADNLVEAALNAAPYLYVLPEQRQALRRQSSSDAARYRQIAEIIDETRRTAAVRN